MQRLGLGRGRTESTAKLPVKVRVRPETSHISTLIGVGTVVEGAVTFSGGLHVDGVVNGQGSAEEGSSEGVMRLGSSGSIRGDVMVPFVLIDGRIEGSVYATEEVRLLANGRIDGDLIYRSLNIEAGGVVNGSLLRLEDVASFAREFERRRSYQQRQKMTWQGDREASSPSPQPGRGYSEGTNSPNQ
jgi:cytoskeletal protein CcmA (bactofilin family)